MHVGRCYSLVFLTGGRSTGPDSALTLQDKRDAR